MNIRVISIIISVLFFVACKNEDVRVYRIAKAPDRSALDLPAGHFGDAMLKELEQTASTSSDLKWVLPKGWSETAGTGMRKATFRAGTAADAAEVSVVSLAGMAGGELSNVNRWRGQIGLDPIDDAEFKKTSTKIVSPAGTAIVIDFSSKESGARSRVIAAMLGVGAQTWFLKMTGSEEVVGKAKADFLTLLKGLKTK